MSRGRIGILIGRRPGIPSITMLRVISGGRITLVVVSLLV
jgi:hypothetical protein